MKVPTVVPWTAHDLRNYKRINKNETIQTYIYQQSVIKRTSGKSIVVEF